MSGRRSERRSMRSENKAGGHGRGTGPNSRTVAAPKAANVRAALKGMRRKTSSSLSDRFTMQQAPKLKEVQVKRKYSATTKATGARLTKSVSQRSNLSTTIAKKARAQVPQIVGSKKRQNATAGKTAADKAVLRPKAVVAAIQGAMQSALDAAIKSAVEVDKSGRVKLTVAGKAAGFGLVPDSQQPKKLLTKASIVTKSRKTAAKSGKLQTKSTATKSSKAVVKSGKLRATSAATKSLKNKEQQQRAKKPSEAVRAGRADRAAGRVGTGGRGAAVPVSEGPRKTAEELDEEMMRYWSTSKKGLDKQLDEYMAMKRGDAETKA